MPPGYDQVVLPEPNNGCQLPCGQLQLGSVIRIYVPKSTDPEVLSRAATATNKTELYGILGGPHQVSDQFLYFSRLLGAGGQAQVYEVESVRVHEGGTFHFEEGRQRYALKLLCLKSGHGNFTAHRARALMAREAKVAMQGGEHLLKCFCMGKLEIINLSNEQELVTCLLFEKGKCDVVQHLMKRGFQMSLTEKLHGLWQ
eukprot:gene799-1113_t